MRASLRRFLGKEKVVDDFGRATEADAYNCYRLFLNREPDEEGLAYWVSMVRDHHISLQNLTDSFLYSDELQAIQERRRAPILVELPDFSIYVRGNDYLIGAVIAREKQYEPHVMHALDKLLSPGMVFLDVGANLGFFTLFAAGRVGSNGRVLAFEAYPDNCDLLERSVSVNGLSNVDVYRYAVAEERRSFLLATGGPHSNARIVDGPSEPYPMQEIEAVALDEVLAEQTRLDVVKMDIEGAEPRAWEGMRELVARHRPVILFEFAPALIALTSNSEPMAFLESIQESDYALFEIVATGKHAGEHQPLDASQLRSLCERLRTHADHVDLMAVPVRE